MANSKPEKIVQNCRVVLVGKTGNGKSSLGNSLLSLTDCEDRFPSKRSLSSVTEKCKRLQGNITSRRLVMSVIDTPGLFDTKNPNSETVTEIMKCIALAAPGPHIFLFVLRVCRYTEEERKCFEILKELFGDGVKKHTIVVFTGTDGFDDDDDIKCIKDFLDSGNSTFLRTFVFGCGNRYVGICNDPLNKNHQRDVDQLINMIMKTMDDNEKGYYEQETFKKAEKVIDLEVSNRITKMDTNQKTKDKVKRDVDKTTQKMAETKVDDKEKECNVPQTHQRAEVADEEALTRKEKVRNEIMDEIESKTDSSPKTGFWGTLTSSLYDGISTVLSVPASYLSGWWS